MERRRRQAGLAPGKISWRYGISAFEDLREQESISLNLEARKLERERTEKERLARENTRRAAHGLEPFASQKEPQGLQGGKSAV